MNIVNLVKINGFLKLDFVFRNMPICKTRFQQNRT